MRLSDYNEIYREYTGKASDVARQLAFAGIAIIWIFRMGEGLSARIPPSLLLPIGLLASALLFDLLHYVASSAIWGTFHRRGESKLDDVSADPELDAPAWFNRPAITLFVLKIGFVLIAYFFIVRFVWRTWT